MNYGAGINTASANGNTPLHEAATFNSARVAEVGDASSEFLVTGCIL